MNVASLWERFIAGRDPEARDRLIEEHVGLVHHVARQVAARLGERVEFGDLLSAGKVGLIQALDGFDPGRGLAFSTYAAPRIRGAILDDLRSRDPASRGARRHERAVAEVRTKLEQELGRMPNDDEVAAALGMDLRTYLRWQESLAALQQLPLDAPIRVSGERSATLGDVVADEHAASPEDAIIHEQRVAALREAMGLLKAQERMVLALYYFENLNLAQIGQVLNLTESRISQIRSKAIGQLRSALGESELDTLA